MLFQSNIIKK
ncbi:hypothetical protein J1605_012748 [Eschrichtius robustus]|uniref:Uncharacterized protein n=1 Tax=Eschrichtius robustus TaxID=9764 RepID=A0AB34GKE8_ESCRO|nr:hypothetical protein J1605_012748 [Eschrichtius robustus]